MKPKFDHKVIRPNGPWIPAAATSVAKTFERIRKLRRANEKELAANAKEASEKVIPIATTTGNDRATAASGDAQVVAGVHKVRKA